MKILKGLFSILMIFILSASVQVSAGVPMAFIAVPLLAVKAAVLSGIIALPVGVAYFDIALITVGDISPDDVEENMGGFPNVGYLGLMPDIATHPTLPDTDTATTPTELATLVGNYTMEALKFFSEIKVPPRTTGAQPEGQGEAGGKSFNNKGSFLVPGTSKAARIGLMRILNNGYGILILVDHDGNRVQYGDENHPCEFRVVGDAGQAPADTNAFTVEWTTDAFAPGWTYNGSIPLSSGTLPPLS